MDSICRRPVQSGTRGDHVGRRQIGPSGRAAVVGVALAIAAASCGSDDDGGGGSSSGPGSGSAGASESRGFDGTTVRVAGVGSAANFAEADIGARARFERANETDELDGIRIEYVEFADDALDPAKATAEIRRLVTQEQVFAIVPNFSAMNPGEYLNEQHVPYVGPGYDDTYCTTEPSESIYGFGVNGCIVPSDPPKLPDYYNALYSYVSEKTGEDEPSIALFGGDSQTSSDAVQHAAVSAVGAGFDVVYSEGVVPATTSDYSPYVQDWLSTDDGDEPDAMDCLLAVQCLDIWAAVEAAGYEGTFETPLYSDLLIEPLAGTVTRASFNPAPNDGLTQMQEDLEAVEPGTVVSTTNVLAYFAADMFIQALAKVGADVTPESVQEALANQTWGIEGFVGPTEYPASKVVATPVCLTLLENDGTEWSVVVPFECSETTFPVAD